MSSSVLIQESNHIDVVPITIQESNHIEGARKILKVIRPLWQKNQIKFKLFTDGLTNKLMGCWVTDSDLSSSSIDEVDKKNVLLIRIYGNNTELLIDRDAETKNITLLQSYNYAPSLYATFENGICYEYVKGVTLTPDTVILSNIWPLVARQLARIHKVQLTKSDSQPMLLEKANRFFELLPAEYNSASKQDRVNKLFTSRTVLRREFDELYRHLEALGNPLVFCHNDLLLGNVIYTESENKVTFIDFEYAALNFQAFDIGNHFAEYSGVDNSDGNRYPSKEYQLKWLKVYLETFEADKKVEEIDVERLYVHVNKFSLASNFLWFLWALIQAHHSKIDFDFIRLAEQRYNEYLAKKSEFLSLTIPAL